jgi:hypothetical protein
LIQWQADRVVQLLSHQLHQQAMRPADPFRCVTVTDRLTGDP